MYKFDITYNEILSFLDELKFKTKIDMKDYTLGSLKRIVGGYMDENNIEGFSELIRWIEINPGNKNDFMKSIIPDKTEFFRDPGLWRYLQEIIPKLAREKAQIKVLDLGTSSGEDLVSLQILLDELKGDDNVQVTAADKYQVKLNEINNSIINDKKIDPSIKNYQRFNGGDFNSFLNKNSEGAILKKKWVNNVDFKVYDLSSSRAFGKFDVVLCRNVMCYYNIKKSRSIYKTLCDFVLKDGLLILGVQEDLSNSFYSRDFKCLNNEFKIFQKNK